MPNRNGKPLSHAPVYCFRASAELVSERTAHLSQSHNERSRRLMQTTRRTFLIYLSPGRAALIRAIARTSSELVSASSFLVEVHNTTFDSTCASLNLTLASISAPVGLNRASFDAKALYYVIATLRAV